MFKSFFRNQLNYRALLYPILMVLAMWVGFLLHNQEFLANCKGAIIPLLPEGLVGIIFSPLLHGSFEHITSNSAAVFVLMFLLFQFYRKLAPKVFIFSWFFSNLLVWMLPPIDVFTGQYRYICIIGASGLVYALAFFLFFSGMLRKNRKLLAIALLVALYYGSLIWSILPEELFNTLSEPSRISWQSHLAGTIVGTVLALIYRKKGEKNHMGISSIIKEKDDKLCQQYIEEDHPDHFLTTPQRMKAFENILINSRKKS